MPGDFVFQGVQVGLETVKGTAVAATRRMSSTGYAWNDQNAAQRIRPMNRMFGTGANRSKQWTELQGKGAVNFNEMGIKLDSLVKSVTATNGAGGDAGAYTRVYEPSVVGANDFRTVTFERGEPGQNGQRAAYGHCIGMEITATREALDITDDWLARETERAFTVTASALDYPDIRAFSDMINVYLDTDAGDIGTTQLVDPWASALRFQGRRGQAWSLNRSKTSWSRAPHLAPTSEFDLRVDNDADADMLDDAFTSQIPLFVRWEALGPLIVGTKYYLLQFDMALKVVATTPPADEQGIDSKLYTLEIVNDVDLGFPMEITLVNSMAATV